MLLNSESWHRRMHLITPRRAKLGKENDPCRAVFPLIVRSNREDFCLRGRSTAMFVDAQTGRWLSRYVDHL